MHITSRQDAIIIGTLLGDGCLEKNGRWTRLRLEHSHKQKSYLEWKYRELQSLVTGSVMPVHAYHKKNKSFYDSFRTYTRSDSALDLYRSKFYLNRKKIIPADLAVVLTHPLSLAIWFMDDGYKRSDCNALRFGTDSFTKDEQYILQSVLKNNFGIEVTVHKKGKYWNLYIPERESKKFIALIERYVIPEFFYKIALTP